MSCHHNCSVQDHLQPTRSTSCCSLHIKLDDIITADSNLSVFDFSATNDADKFVRSLRYWSRTPFSSCYRGLLEGFTSLPTCRHSSFFLSASTSILLSVHREQCSGCGVGSVVLEVVEERNRGGYWGASSDGGPHIGNGTCWVGGVSVGDVATAIMSLDDEAMISNRPTELSLKISVCWGMGQKCYLNVLLLQNLTHSNEWRTVTRSFQGDISTSRKEPRYQNLE